MALTGKVICSNLYGVGDSTLHLTKAYKDSVKIVERDRKITAKNLPLVWYYYVDLSIYKVEYREDMVLVKESF